MFAPCRSLSIFIALSATCVAAGCGGARSPHLAAATLLPCQLSRFVVTVGPYVSEATGQHTLALRLENRGSVTCVLDGYPRVALYDQGSGVIPFVVRRGGDQMISSDPPKAIKIPIGGHAFVVMNKYRCDRGPAPGSRPTQRIRLSSGQPRTPSASIIFNRQTMEMSYRIPNYCGEHDPGSTLTVSPFVGTLGAALGR